MLNWCASRDALFKNGDGAVVNGHAMRSEWPQDFPRRRPAMRDGRDVDKIF